MVQDIAVSQVAAAEQAVMAVISHVAAYAHRAVEAVSHTVWTISHHMHVLEQVIFVVQV